MNTFLRSIIIFLLLTSSNAFADNPQILGWEDLVPKQAPLENPLSHLDTELRLDIEYLASIRYWQKTGQISEVDTEYEYGIELEHKLKKSKVDFEPLITKYDAFLDEIEHRNKLVVSSLEAKLVRIPGYALPLETSGAAITEFLLVPTIGACIHTPVPPANQMVFVHFSKARELKGLFEPVWVTGRMKIEQQKRSVVYSDGEGGVESAYTIQGANIEPYTGW